MSRLKQVLMERDGLSEREIDSWIEEAKQDLAERLKKGDVPLGICEEWFGLEPDYLDDLI